MYESIWSLYDGSVSALLMDSLISRWFQVTSGVWLGDNLSPTLFNMYLNDLARTIKEAGKGLMVDNQRIELLLYADDTVLLTDSERKLQDCLNVVHDWCNRWRMSLKTKKDVEGS